MRIRLLSIVLFLVMAVSILPFSAFAMNCTDVSDNNFFGPQVVAASTNEATIYSFLKNTMGLNTAAACGVLANIECESSFNPSCKVLDTNGLYSYGICQWNGSRYDNLQTWCKQHGYDYTTVTGQLYYLKYEMEGGDSTSARFFPQVKNVSNTSSGAGTAAHCWAQYIERCSEIQTYQGKSWNEWDRRAEKAKNTYWPRYGNDPVPDSNTKSGFTCSITSPGGTITANKVCVVKGTATSARTITKINAWVENAAGKKIISASCNPGGTSYSFAGSAIDNNLLFQKITENGQYYFKVTISDDKTTSQTYPFPFKVTGGTDPVQRPGKSELINMSSTYISGEPIVFSWKNTSNTTHYNVYIQENSSGCKLRRPAAAGAEPNGHIAVPAATYRK